MALPTPAQGGGGLLRAPHPRFLPIAPSFRSLKETQIILPFHSRVKQREVLQVLARGKKWYNSVALGWLKANGLSGKGMKAAPDRWKFGAFGGDFQHIPGRGLLLVLPPSVFGVCPSTPPPRGDGTDRSSGSGMSQRTSLSSRPGRRSAASMRSGRDVAATTKMPVLAVAGPHVHALRPQTTTAFHADQMNSHNNTCGIEGVPRVHYFVDSLKGFLLSAYHFGA